MSGPTREGVDRLALNLNCSYLAHADDQRPWTEVEHDRVVELLRSYPLPAGEPPTAESFREWRHSCHAVQGEPVLWAERCPHCGMPREISMTAPHSCEPTRIPKRSSSTDALSSSTSPPHTPSNSSSTD